jgi:hypothetical protein
MANAADTIVAHEATIAKLQKQLHAHQGAVAEKSEKLSDLEQSKATGIHQMTTNARSEKESPVPTYETALTRLTKQCDTHWKELETDSCDLAESKARNRKAKSLIVALKRERLQLQSNIDSLAMKSQRDAEVRKATVRNVQPTAQSTVTQKLQDLKARFGNEKWRIFSIAADWFRAFFNAADSIEELLPRQLLSGVKNELRRLAESDVLVRRLVRAALKQSTDDAVAHLLTA